MLRDRPGRHGRFLIRSSVAGLALGGALWGVAVAASGEPTAPERTPTWQVEATAAWPSRRGRVTGAVTRVPRPLSLPHTCTSRAFPRLAGPWVIHCGPSGEPDRALDLSTGDTVRLRGPTAHRAVGAGWMYAAGADGGLWTLPETAPSGPVDRLEGLVAAPAMAGTRVAAATADAVAIFTRGASLRRLYEARPAPWYPPAIAGDWVVWTDLGQDPPMLLGLQEGTTRPVVFARGRHRQHHPVASDRWLAWFDGPDLVVADTSARTRTRWVAEGGFEGPPALWGPQVCWGDRRGGLMQVRCSDGWTVPGRNPSIAGPLTLVHHSLGPILHAATEVRLEPGDWRIEPLDGQEGLLTLPPWWGTGPVTVEVHEPSGYRPVARVHLEQSPVQVRVPLDVEIRIIPDEPVPRGLR